MLTGLIEFILDSAVFCFQSLPLAGLTCPVGKLLILLWLQKPYPRHLLLGLGHGCIWS